MENTHEKVQKILIGNKSDLISMKSVDSAAARALADTTDMSLFEASAKDGSSLNEAFNTLSLKMKQVADEKSANVKSSSKDDEYWFY
jgi:signal recognition particle receptor subunit beta